MLVTNPRLAESFRFGEAGAANGPEMHALREKLEESFGKQAVIEMSVGIAFARFYPTLKRELGYVRSCAALRFDFAGSAARGHG